MLTECEMMDVAFLRRAAIRNLVHCAQSSECDQMKVTRRNVVGVV